jgi:hypothetical protein
MAKSKSQKKQQKGGEGAADNAIKVFGNANDQHAVSENNNTIAMNGTSSVQAPAMKGGKGILSSLGLISEEPKPVVGEKVKEGAVGEEVKEGAVGEETNEGAFVNPYPVVGGKQSKKQLQKTIKKQLKQLKQQGGSLSFSEYSPATQPGAAPKEGMTEDAADTYGAPGSVLTQKGGEGKQGIDAVLKGFMKAGDKMSKQQLQQLNQQLDKLQQKQQQGGVGLNEIVVPLVLLYASQKYAQGKTAKKNAKPLSKSMHSSRKFSK